MWSKGWCWLSPRPRGENELLAHGCRGAALPGRARGCQPPLPPLMPPSLRSCRGALLRITLLAAGFIIGELELVKVWAGAGPSRCRRPREAPRLAHRHGRCRRRLTRSCPPACPAPAATCRPRGRVRAGRVPGHRHRHQVLDRQPRRALHPLLPPVQARAPPLLCPRDEPAGATALPLVWPRC